MFLFKLNTLILSVTCFISIMQAECDEGYTHIEDLPDNVANNNNEDQCFFNDDLAVIDSLIDLNSLDYSEALEVGVQIWNFSRLASWVLTYTPNGSNGINQQLTTLPDNIGDLSSLSSLYLEWNQLTILPDSFSQLTNLFNLTLNNNWLTSLPEDFGNINNLFFLDLGYNQLTSIPESICNINFSTISYLYLFNNNLTSAPNCMCELDINWSGLDGGSYPYFAIGGNQLCEDIPACIANSEYFESTLDQFYYSFIEGAPQDCSEMGINDIPIPVHNFKIQRLYPNPFNPVLQIEIIMEFAGEINIEIIDLNGKIVEVLHSGYLNIGTFQFSWEPVSLSAGTYLISLQRGNNNVTKKVVFLK